jgi:hypothetical protein
MRLGGRARRLAGGLVRALRGGDPFAQRGAIELAVQRVRQRVAAHEPVRLPRGRQLGADVRFQCGIVRIVRVRGSAQRDACDRRVDR